MTNDKSTRMSNEQLSGDDTADRTGVGGLAGASVSGTEDAMLEGAGVAAEDSNEAGRTPHSGGSTVDADRSDEDDGLTQEPADDSSTGDDITNADATGSGLMGNPG